MSQTPILVMPDFDIEFEVQIDANDDAGVNSKRMTFYVP
jgi:hypothetical protein